jgi:ATP-dependent Clp protease ATP-binding subunit ClpA
LTQIQQRLDKKNIHLQFTPELKKYISTVGYDPVFGARPLKRVIQDQLLDELALQIIEKKIENNATVKVDSKDGQIVITQPN